MNHCFSIFLLLVMLLSLTACHKKVLTEENSEVIKSGMYQGKVNAKRIIHSLQVDAYQYEMRSIITDGNSLSSSGEKGTILYKKGQYHLVTDSILVTKQNPSSKDLILSIRGARMGTKSGHQAYVPFDEKRETPIEYCACGEEYLIRYQGKCFALISKSDFLNKAPDESQSNMVIKKCESWDDNLAK